jgi:hypothetical protein
VQIALSYLVENKESKNMATFTISASSLEELLAAADELRGDAPAPVAGDAPAPVAGDAAPKQTRGRRKAEAPAPAQPETAAAPGANPFTAPQTPPAGDSPFGAGFTPGAADPHANTAAERPVVTKLKKLLETLSAQHGDTQVFGWAMHKALGLPPSVTKEEFLATLIHEQPDAALETVYTQGGGGKN